jgi:protein-S-isoprenylcysteine O-methyltransferase Ste14
MPGTSQRQQRFDAIPRSADASGWVDRAIWVGAIVFTVLGTLFTLALLRQRDGSNPWARLNVYTVGFLIVAGLVGIGGATTFLRSALRSRSGIGEAFGVTYDPGMLLFVLILQAGGLAVVLDYGHWHLVPALEQPTLQALGLAFAVAGAVTLSWTDRWLARHFASEEAAARLMTGGPYRFVRHPRYASFLLFALSIPLVFASILGWPLWFAWVVAFRHRIAREEPHLRELFGHAYDAYASRTARLVPGVY